MKDACCVSAVRQGGRQSRSATQCLSFSAIDWGLGAMELGQVSPVEHSEREDLGVGNQRLGALADRPLGRQWVGVKIVGRDSQD
jgi:hypothetical protein